MKIQYETTLLHKIPTSMKKSRNLDESVKYLRGNFSVTNMTYCCEDAKYATEADYLKFLDYAGDNGPSVGIGHHNYDSYERIKINYCPFCSTTIVLEEVATYIEKPEEETLTRTVYRRHRVHPKDGEIG